MAKDAVHYKIEFDEIATIAGQNGFNFKELNINQIEASILKGIDAAIEDVRDQIIIEAIRSAQDSPESARRERKRAKSKSDEGCYQYPEHRKVF